MTTPESHESQISDHGLNKFQRALVHQIVRKIPGLTAITRTNFIQVIDYDEKRETSHQAQKNKYFKRDLQKQIGLRWPIEAMAGGDLTDLDHSQFLAYVDGRQEVVAEHLEDLKTGLQDKRTVLVGHNVFMDLMYFYKCFFGTLPDKVEDFQRVIHELFPLVIDTKYLATHNRENPAMANSSLEQLDVDLAKLPFDKVPAIGRVFHSLVTKLSSNSVPQNSTATTRIISVPHQPTKLDTTVTKPLKCSFASPLSWRGQELTLMCPSPNLLQLTALPRRWKP